MTMHERDEGISAGTGAHVSWERLNDFADGQLAAAEAEAVARHVAACSSCLATAERIRALAERARHLPAAIEPDGRLWGDVAAALAVGGSGTRRERAPRGEAEPSRRPRRWVASPRWLAAAAVVLMAGSSAATAYLMRGGSPSAAMTGGAAALPAGFTATEAAFQRDVAGLEALLTAQRAALTPETIAIVDRSLATIDGAIAEAREALLADPANHALAELLAASYRQKVELMRRAAEFPNTL